MTCRFLRRSTKLHRHWARWGCSRRTLKIPLYIHSTTFSTRQPTTNPFRSPHCRFQGGDPWCNHELRPNLRCTAFHEMELGCIVRRGHILHINHQGPERRNITRNCPCLPQWCQLASQFQLTLQILKCFCQTIPKVAPITKSWSKWHSRSHLTSKPSQCFAFKQCTSKVKLRLRIQNRLDSKILLKLKQPVLQLLRLATKLSRLLSF